MDAHFEETIARILALNALMREDIALVRLTLRAERAANVLREALEQKFNPNWSSQPRAPAGASTGGEWIGGGSLRNTPPPAPQRPMPTPIRLEKDPRPRSFTRSVMQIESVLGHETNRIASHSPTISQNLKVLEDDDWEIELVGDGVYPEGSATNPNNHRIYLDRMVLRDPSEALRTLSHELGHARDPPQEETSENAYVLSSLRQEGYATLMNIRIQREILASRAVDIGVSTTNPANIPRYQAIYDRYLRDGDEDAAASAIGAIYEFGEWKGRIRYGEYYRQYYRATYSAGLR